MKTLLLMRHAKSSWAEEGMPDHERPLNERGHRDAPKMGQFLKKKGLVPQRIVTSSANRAESTAERLVSKLDDVGPIVVTEELYHAFPEQIIGVVHLQPDDVEVLMLVGHNPGMESLVSMFLDRPESIPTATITRLDLDIDRWAELTMKTPIVASDVWRPKDVL